ncbi:hypothetical protein UPYG_G00310300 [Umbra pygmaea]|uniref:Uncharacterized protein n=1 Tax=Umbra pygmaea TaxID=75934 RepID=A0ABD0W3X0_UMBPY
MAIDLFFGYFEIRTTFIIHTLTVKEIPMAGFFQQLRLLLWKNGLGVIRQPGWTVSLLVWPLVIFLILAITRSQFPPQRKDTCYVAPRNLPSTGFFPFLQTLMCNTDSSCQNKSHLFTNSLTKKKRATGTNHDTNSRVSLLPPGMSLLKMGGDVRAVLKETTEEPQLLDLWDMFLNASHQGIPMNLSFIEGFNSTLLGDEDSLDAMLESVTTLKRSFCSFSLTAFNMSSMPDPLAYSLATFCQSNDTLLEVSLLTINQVLTEMFMKDPAQTLTMMGTAVGVFERLQNENSLWEGLLSLPRLLMSSTSDMTLDQVLSEGESLLHNFNRTLTAIESSLPEANSSSVFKLKPAIVGGINLFQYIRNWHGKDIYITLGDVITVPPNTSTADIATVTALMQQVKIPLDNVVSLTMDKDLLQSYICNGNISDGLQEACNREIQHMLGWVDLDKVSQQTLLVWSEYAAQDDITFSKGLLQSLLGLLVVPSDQDSNNTRSRRSSVSQPQNVKEEMFLTVGSVAMDLLKDIPGWKYIQIALDTGHASIQLAMTTLNTLVEMMEKVWTAAHIYQETFIALMSNQTMADIFTGQVMNSAVKTIMKGLGTQGPVDCEHLLEEWSWLSPLSSVQFSLWKTFLCSRDRSALQDALLTEWMPVANVLFNFLNGFTTNATIPMIIADWHEVSASLASANGSLANFTSLFDNAYLAGWDIEDFSEVDWTQILIKRAFDAFILMGTQLQNSPLWPSMESYFHIGQWIMNYQPNITAPPNCTLDPNTYAPICKTGFNWQKFVSNVTPLLQEFSANPASVVRIVQGSLNFMESVYGNNYTGTVIQLLSSGRVPGNASIPALLENLFTILNNNFSRASNDISLEQFSANPQLPLSFVREMLDALGLNPLETLWIQEEGAHPLNASSVMAIALEVA